MNLINELDEELHRQAFDKVKSPDSSMLLERYKTLASGYAEIENAVAVLSDMHANVSYIYYGGFSELLGLSKSGNHSESIDSIWEKEILDRIDPDNLHDKYLHELRFFHFVKRQDRMRREDWCLLDRLNMSDDAGHRHQTLHRMYYVSSPTGNSLWLALCLYNILPPGISGNTVLNTRTGETLNLGASGDNQILTARETEVLRLIDTGLMSMDIAGRLSISIHTVSRHRQNILDKLQVKNSIEACRIARELGLI